MSHVEEPLQRDYTGFELCPAAANAASASTGAAWLHGVTCVHVNNLPQRPPCTWQHTSGYGNLA